MNILELHNLKKYFATQKAVDDISMSLEQGNIFGLLGPNGAGKTTLIRMITGIFYPDAGDIILKGKKFDPENDVKHIGYMPEERGLYKKMKVGEQLVFLTRLKGLSKEEAEKNVVFWMKKFQIESWWNKKVNELSKGMSQKVQFIATVSHQPKLIILDEPFSGLDPINTNLIKEEIQRLKQEGASILFSTHRMEQVEEMCEHIVLINKGKVVLNGEVNEVRDHYKENLYEVKTETSIPQSMQELFDVIPRNEKHYHIRLKSGQQNNDILNWLLSHNIRIKSFNELLPTFNEIFIKTVNEDSHE